MYEAAVETSDRSYYTDRLTELTGKPRIYWGKIPFQELKQIYRKEIKGNEVNFYESRRSGSPAPVDDPGRDYFCRDRQLEGKKRI
ncbi:MAG: hypothetical protein HYZ85_05915 [Candidatus Omnitrophica bacterium]|nr:hypothetical protein [Candidatus Omnitrophota bacterium]